MKIVVCGSFVIVIHNVSYKYSILLCCCMWVYTQYNDCVCESFHVFVYSVYLGVFANEWFLVCEYGWHLQDVFDNSIQTCTYTCTCTCTYNLENSFIHIHMFTYMPSSCGVVINTLSVESFHIFQSLGLCYTINLNFLMENDATCRSGCLWDGG